MAEIVCYPGPGCIVEYMEGNAPQIAQVLEEQDGKLRLLLPNRRETRLGSNRLLPWSGPALPPPAGRDEAVRNLESRRALRETLAADIDVMAVWETAQGEVAQASAQWFAELGSQAPDVDTVAAYGRALLICKSHFKFQPPYFEVHSQETVQARLAEREAARRREALVNGGAAFFRLLWETHNKKRASPLPGDAHYPEPEPADRLKEMLLSRIADPETQDSEGLWRTLVKGLPDVQHLPLHLAAAWGLVPPHHNFWMDRADYSPGDAWAEKFRVETAALVEAAREADEPLLDLPFLSIDSATTRDVDDAYYVERAPEDPTVLRLHLALACPVLRWPFDDPLDKAVLRRATSIYLPEGAHHMLPESLGTDAYSLTAGETRPALCLTCDVSADGAVLACVPALRRVRLAANLTFEDCEAVLAAGPDDLPANAAAAFAEQLHLGERLARIRQTARIAAGAVIMDRPDPKIVLTGQGADVKVLMEVPSCAPRAQSLVAEMMILASAACALLGREKGIPLFHRAQDVAIPKEYAGVWTSPHDIARIIRALTPSCLETQPRPHAGLGLCSYAPVTSPLRRYPDFINEAQIVSWLREGRPRLDQAALESLLAPLNTRLDAAGQVQRFRPRYWKLLYVRQMGDHVWWDAVVTEENDNFCSVSLPREQIVVRGRRRLFGERACPGQRVRVRIGKVNPLYNEITLLEVVEA